MRLLTARLVTAVAVLAMPALAGELKPETSQAFDRYTALAEQQLNTGPFLYVDAHPEAKASALRGETVVTEPKIDGVPVPDGLIHDWLGVLFIRGATIDRVRALMQDYDDYKRIYAPDVTDSRLLARDGDRFRVCLKLYKKEFLTLVYDSEYDVRYSAPAPGRMEILSRSTRIRQEGDDHGFLWRLNSYWRFEEADGGVYAQCRAISLSRGIPFGFGWLHGFLQKFPRDSMVNTLEATRRAAVTASRGSATRN
jgi:hypothetical protein